MQRAHYYLRNIGWIVHNIVQSLNPAHVVALSFFTLILIGSIILYLPFSYQSSQSYSYLDALFTSTSATCVTGLVVVDTGSFYTRFGTTVIMFLIQIGGLGIMTFSTFFTIILGRNISMRSSVIIQDHLDYGNRDDLYSLVRSIVRTTLIFELFGFALLAIRWIPERGLGDGTYCSLFHSVSAFCNAGFSLYSNSLEGYRGDWLISGTILILVILGGLGFVVLRNIGNVILGRISNKYVLRPRLSFQTKVVLLVSAILFWGCIPLFLLFEWNNTLEGLPLDEKLLTAMFQVATPRTAGFNSLPINRLTLVSLALLMSLMFIGASPGSTGGGIKTTTLAVTLAMVYNMLRSRKHIQLFRRTINRSAIHKSVSIVSVSYVLIVIASLLLLYFETHVPDVEHGQGQFARIIFEVLSAFGTVGLSTGITNSLSSIGKAVTILVMFAGRIGPLTLALALGQSKEKPADYRYPEAKIMVG